MNSHVPADSVEGRVRMEQMLSGVLDVVNGEMRGQPASMVYETLTLTLARRMPGIPMDAEVLKDAAARIAVGVPPV